jgi:hypothetical protein
MVIIFRLSSGVPEDVGDIPYKKNLNLLCLNHNIRDRLHIEGRYPDALSEAPSKKEAVEYFNRGQEVFQWLMKRS